MTGFVTYLRVSTDRQGKSGLGIEAQRAAVASYGAIAEFVEIESGKLNDRPQLAAAMRLCRVHKATLVIAKLDRLSRDAHFLLGLAKTGIEFIAADMPAANRLTISIMAVVAEAEREMISTRTKAALAAAKGRGVKLGGDRGGRATRQAIAAGHATMVRNANQRAADVLPLIRAIQATGMSAHNAIARELSKRRVPKARGGFAWTNTDVRNMLARV